MNANDYSREWYSCSETEGDFELKHFNIEHDKENQIALIKMAQKFQPKLTFWVSPWSPPAWMKINKDYCVLSSRFNNQPKEKDALLYGGGESDAVDPNEMWLQGDRRKPFPRRLATQNYFIQEPMYLQAYADMFVRFVELYRKEGVPIDMVMYQNEAYSYTPYPGCPWTAEGTVRFNRDYLAPALKAKAPGVKLYLGTFNTNRRSYIEQIFDAPGMLDVVDGFGFQWEGRDVMEAITDKYPGSTASAPSRSAETDAWTGRPASTRAGSSSRTSATERTNGTTGTSSSATWAARAGAGARTRSSASTRRRKSSRTVPSTSRSATSRSS
jgi:glucosylceramidase